MALGGILFAIIILGTTACVAQIYWYRAGSVAALEHSSGYTVIPIFSILSRAGGEAAATGLGGIGVGACIFLWLSPEGSAGRVAGHSVSGGCCRPRAASWAGSPSWCIWRRWDFWR